jgi:PBSX family phage terminase large subunit
MINKTDKQIEAINLIKSNTTTLLEGGSRSGKTFIAIYAIFARALQYPGTWHVCARLRLNHARSSLWNKTIPDVARALGIYEKVEFNKSELIATVNDSKIIIAGLDDKERTEKILGNEYATIYINEASQVGFDAYEVLTTRLNPPKNVPARYIIDYNPPSQNHWGYKIFHDRKFPDGRPVPANDYAVIKMNPKDNIQNLSTGYISALENLSGTKRKRFIEGEYGVEEGALWNRDWIKYEKQPDTLLRVVVGVDPSGSVDGDEVGIIVVGIDRAHNVYVIADYSMNGTPNEWSAEVLAAYDRYQADVIAAEKNFGGDMVEAVINQMGRKSANVKLVTASRGKAVRAEPVAAMYQRGEVLHSRPFTALEDELCTWRPDSDDSPNRLDALVWAVTELLEGGYFSVKQTEVEFNDTPDSMASGQDW